MDFKPHTEEKNWGYVTHIFGNDHAGVSNLQIKAGQCCSRHYHFERVNVFAVQEGKVVVERWEESIGCDRRTFFEKKGLLRVLEPGDVCEIPTYVVHRFRVLKSGKLTEVYYPSSEGFKVRQDDIVRLDIGGPDPVERIRSDIETGESW